MTGHDTPEAARCPACERGDRTTHYQHIVADREAEIARLREALGTIVRMERYVTSPTRLDLVVTLGRAIDVAKSALGLLDPVTIPPGLGGDYLVNGDARRLEPGDQVKSTPNDAKVGRP